MGACRPEWKAREVLQTPAHRFQVERRIVVFELDNPFSGADFNVRQSCFCGTVLFPNQVTYFCAAFGQGWAWS